MSAANSLGKMADMALKSLPGLINIMQDPLVRSRAKKAWEETADELERRVNRELVKTLRKLDKKLDQTVAKLQSKGSAKKKKR